MNTPQLNFDMISKILNMRMKIKKKEREDKEMHMDKFIEVENEILQLFIKETAVYSDPYTQIKDNVYYNYKEVLEDLKCY